MKILPRFVCPLMFILWISAPGSGHEFDGPAMLLADDSALECPTPAPPAPVVTVKVLVPACADADKNLEYRILVENCSPAAAYRVAVLDLIPANAKFVRASPQPHGTGPELQWQLGTLKANSCQEITLVLRPTNTEDVTNCVRVQFEHGVCVTTRQAGSGPKKVPPEDGIIPKKPWTEEPPLSTGSKLELTVKGPEKAVVNEWARYRITVANVGTGPASAVSIESELPDKLTFVRASDGGKSATGLPGVIAWSLGDLPAGKSRTVELTVQAKEKGVFCIKTWAMFGPVPGTFTARKETCTTFTTFVGVPAVLLEMSDREDPIPVNGTASYPIRITNQGSATVTNVRLEAFVPAGMQLLDAILAPVKYRVEGKTIIFEPVASLEPGAELQYEVHTLAVLPGDMRFKIRLTADQLKEGGPVHEEESTTVYSEDLPAPVQTQRRPVEMPLATD